MLLLLTRLQNFVDLIVAQSASKNAEELTRLNHYVWICLIAWPVSILAISYNVYIKAFFLASLISAFSLFLLSTLFLLSHTRKIFLVYHSTNFIFFVLLLYMVCYATPEDSSRILWVYTYPLGAIFLFGNKTGFLWSSLLLISIVLIFRTFFLNEQIYTYPFQVRFTLIYAVITCMITWIEYHRNRYQNESIEIYQVLLEEKHQLKEEIKKRTLLEDELLHMAQIDGLTGAYNRRSFWDMAQKEIQRAKRYHVPICLVILDIDNFKYLNDTYGHPAGDKVLQSLSTHCMNMIRRSDMFARIGGEEFAFLFSHATKEDVLIKMELLRQETEYLVTHYETFSLSCTISIGIAALEDGSDTLETLYKKADACLYQAKFNGRNSVYVSASSK